MILLMVSLLYMYFASLRPFSVDPAFSHTRLVDYVQCPAHCWSNYFSVITVKYWNGRKTKPNTSGNLEIPARTCLRKQRGHIFTQIITILILEKTYSVTVVTSVPWDMERVLRRRRLYGNKYNHAVLWHGTAQNQDSRGSKTQGSNRIHQAQAET